MLKDLITGYRAALDIAIDRFTSGDPILSADGRARLNCILVRVKKLVEATPDNSAKLGEITELLNLEKEIAHRIQLVGATKSTQASVA